MGAQAVIGGSLTVSIDSANIRGIEGPTAAGRYSQTRMTLN